MLLKHGFPLSIGLLFAPGELKSRRAEGDDEKDRWEFWVDDENSIFDSDRFSGKDTLTAIRVKSPTSRRYSLPSSGRSRLPGREGIEEMATGAISSWSSTRY